MVTARDGLPGIMPLRVPAAGNLEGWMLHRAMPDVDESRPYKTRCSCGRWFYIIESHLHGVWSGEHDDQFDDYPFPLRAPAGVPEHLARHHTDEEVRERDEERASFDGEVRRITDAGGVWGPVDTRFASPEAIAAARSYGTAPSVG